MERERPLVAVLGGESGQDIKCTMIGAAAVCALARIVDALDFKLFQADLTSGFVGLLLLLSGGSLTAKDILLLDHAAVDSVRGANQMN